jgi:pyruvate formate lyase activating enzyme
MPKKEAMFYKKLKDKKVHCYLCNQYCVIPDGERGKCHVRENNDGILYSLVYGKVVAASIDPIEKKPLFHFMPGSTSYSIATVGCNFHCEFFQNCEISQPGKEIRGAIYSPEEIVEAALNSECKSISYTYTEPTIFFEYAFDIAKIAQQRGLKNVFVTNGYITEEPLKMIAPFLDAANIDLKSFNDKFYQEVIGARLQPVLDSIKLYHKNGIFIEITTLIIPGKNDSDGELTKIAEFIASVDKNIPWHVSRFHPDYKMMDQPVTPEDTLIRAYKIGKKAGLNFIYAGNIPGNDHESTFCPKCGKKIIQRYGFRIGELKIKNKKCAFCGVDIHIEVE